MRPILMWMSLLLLVAFTVCRADGLRLENRDLAIQFAPEDAGMGVVALEHRAGGGAPEPFVTATPETARVWQIGINEPGVPESKLIYIQNNAPCRRSSRFDAAAGTAELCWDGLDIGEEKGVLDVVVTIRMPAGSLGSFWKIAVKNRSTRYGVWQVFFPLFAGFGEVGKIDLAIPRWNSGLFEKGITTAFSGAYPSAGWCMQYLMFSKGDRGLLVGLRDPEAWMKRYYVQPGKDMMFNIFAPNAGQPGVGFQSSMELWIEAYRGSWWTGAKRYRDWALTAPWAKRGPIAQRKDYPATLRRVALWGLAPVTRTFDTNVQVQKNAVACLDVPLGVHWYCWHRYPFDVNYPEYFPAKPGFAAAAKELTASGMTVMPYINGRLWDMKGPRYPEAFPWTAKQPANRGSYVENYGSVGPKMNFAAMCPATAFWQHTVQDTVRRIWTEYGANAVYLDQISSMGYVMCFDPTHGHPLGGGNYWAQGYRDMLKPLADEAAVKGYFLTSEDFTETYMDTLDGFLTWSQPNFEKEIPIVSAVYSGYTVCFGTPCPTTPDIFVRTQGRGLLWGRQLGWMELRLLIDSTTVPGKCTVSQSPQAEYLLRCARYRQALEKYLLEGELLGELTLQEAAPSTGLPPVYSAVWRAPDGRVLLLLANVTGEAHTVDYTIGAQWGLPAGKLTVTRIQPGTREEVGEVAQLFSRQDTLPPREFLALEISRK